jgi:hypothetical protein
MQFIEFLVNKRNAEVEIADLNNANVLHHFFDKAFKQLFVEESGV